MSDVFQGNEMNQLPLPWLPRDMWWEIGRFIESPTDWLQFRACCATFRKVATKRDFGVEALRCVGKLKGHSDWVRCLTVFEGMLVSASDDRTIKYWDVQSGKCLNTMTAHFNWIYCLIVFDSKLYSGSGDNTIKIWNSKGECLKTLEGHSGSIYCLCPAFDNEFLASGSFDDTIKLWSKEGICVKTLIHDSDSFSILTSFHDVLVSSGDNSIKLWNRAGDCVKTLDTSSSDIVTLHVVNEKLFGGSSDKTMKIWDPNEDWKCVQIIESEAYPRLFQFYKGYLCVGSCDITTTNSGSLFVVEILDLESIRKMKIKLHQRLILSVVEFEGKLIVGSVERAIQIYDSLFPYRFVNQEQSLNKNIIE